MNNPEFQRQLWLEITPHRLLAMPCIIGLGAMAIIQGSLTSRTPGLAVAAVAGFALLTFLWGARLAANSVIDEITERTWEWQRLSSQSPWTLTWGKLFGSTSFAWYGGAMCLAVFALSSPSDSIANPLLLVLSIVTLAIALQAGALACALHFAHSPTVARRRSVGILLTLVALAAAQLTLPGFWSRGVAIDWWGNSYAQPAMVAWSATAFALWAVLGAWRAMCARLSVPTLPVAWLGFFCFVVVYASGFLVGEGLSGLESVLYSGLFCGIALTYAMLFSEPVGALTWRRLHQHVSSRDWRRSVEALPLWPLTVGLSICCALTLTVAYSARTVDDLVMLPVPMVLLVLRDAGIVIFFAASPKPSRAVGAAVVYLLILYWVLPGFLTLLGFSDLARIVLPIGNKQPWLATLIAAAQVALVWWFAIHRLRAAMTPTRTADAG